MNNTEIIPTLQIGEAGQRQPRRRWYTLGTVLVLVLAGVLTNLGIAIAGETHRQPSRSATALPAVAAEHFAGTWHVHTTYVEIRTDGRGLATWPTHIPCGNAKAQSTAGAACDTMSPETVVISGIRTNVEEITDGGRAVVQLRSVTGMRARAVISGSTEPSVLPDGDAVLAVTRTDLLYLTPAGPTTSSPFGRSGLCGVRAAALSVAQQNAAHINCGA